jgi:hypothetical protein
MATQHPITVTVQASDSINEVKRLGGQWATTVNELTDLRASVNNPITKLPDYPRPLTDLMDGKRAPINQTNKYRSAKITSSLAHFQIFSQT